MHKTLFLSSLGALALTASAALAAEPLPPPPPPPIFTWTGPYIGGQIGYGWGPSSFDLIGFDPTKTNLNVFVIDNGNSPSGVIGGAHVGYLYQFNQWFVVGIEGSVDGTSLRANAQFFLPDFVGTNNILNAHVTSDIQGTLRGKLGFAWDRVLLYGTGGVAFGGFSGDLLLQQLTSAGVPFPIASRYFSNNSAGWTAGGGIEYAVLDNWWIFAEYRYTEFGSFSNPLSNFFAPVNYFSTTSNKFGNAGVNNNNPHLRENLVQVGFSYRFNLLPPPPPIVAKY